MADKQENFNIPQQFADAYTPENARQLMEKSNYYRQILGDDFVSRGFQQLGPQFFTILDTEISRNPNILANLSASSGMRSPNFKYGEPDMPGMANARVGTNIDNFRAGVSVPFIQGQDTTYRRMPATYDVGYNTGLFGGNLDVSGGVTPKEGYMPQTMYNLIARYTKKF
jgi:hypothetical protein